MVYVERIDETYFAGSIRGGRDKAEAYEKMIHYINERMRVLTEHIGKKDLNAMGETSLTDEQIHDRDMAWIRRAGNIIAETSVPSLGVGYEIGRAIEKRMPVLCLFEKQEGKRLSAMITGSRKALVVEYNLLSDVYGNIDSFIDHVKGHVWAHQIHNLPHLDGLTDKERNDHLLGTFENYRELGEYGMTPVEEFVDVTNLKSWTELHALIDQEVVFKCVCEEDMRPKQYTAAEQFLFIDPFEHYPFSDDDPYFDDGLITKHPEDFRKSFVTEHYASKRFLWSASQQVLRMGPDKVRIPLIQTKLV